MTTDLKTTSLETSRLLRKRRFNEPVLAYYDTDGQLCQTADMPGIRMNNPTHDKDARHQVYAAPTLPQAQQWLREKKRYDVLVDRDYFYGKVGKYYAKIIRLKDGAMSETGKYRHYDQALEAGLLKALRTM
jgi:hypothetical protein